MHSKNGINNLSQEAEERLRDAIDAMNLQIVKGRRLARSTREKVRNKRVIIEEEGDEEEEEEED